MPPIRLPNSTRLHDLIRAGNLYLTAQDAIALALENNIDIEVARYNPLLSAWQLERAQAGGAVAGRPQRRFASRFGRQRPGRRREPGGRRRDCHRSQRSTSASRQRDHFPDWPRDAERWIRPSRRSTTFSHTTTPQPDMIQSMIPVLVSNTRVYTASYQEGFLTGGTVTVTYSDHYLNENAPTDVLNPSVAPNLSISFQHNLLRGFGVAVNARNITVAKMNLNISDLNFKTQVISTVAQRSQCCITALVADYEDIKAKKERA